MRMISEGCRRHTAQWPCFYQLEYEMYNSQGKNNFQPLSSTMATLPTASATFIDKGGYAHSKRWKSWCYFAMIGSRRLVFSRQYSQLLDTSIRIFNVKTYDHRESALRLSSGSKKKTCKFCSKSGNVEKLVFDNNVSVRVRVFIRRYCSSPTKPSDFFKSSDYKTVVRQEQYLCEICLTKFSKSRRHL